jgi:hypothetical protein
MSKFIVVTKGLIDPKAPATTGTVSATTYGTEQEAQDRSLALASGAPGTTQEVYELVLKGSASTPKAVFTAA